MRVHMSLLLVVAWLATSHADPQRSRQDNPLAMGMKLLGNLRNTMSSAVSGLFRPRGRPVKARPQRPPPPHHQHHLAPNAPQFVGHQFPDHVTHHPENSFFTVLHEESEVTHAPPPPPHSRPHVDDDDHHHQHHHHHVDDDHHHVDDDHHHHVDDDNHHHHVDNDHHHHVDDDHHHHVDDDDHHHVDDDHHHHIDDDGNDSFQPSSFFSSNRPFQGSFGQEAFSAPKRPNEFNFGKPKDERKFHSTFSQEVITRPSHQNFHSSGEVITRPSHQNFQSSDEFNTRPSHHNFQSSGEVNTRPSHHNFQSSGGFQRGSGLQLVSPPNFSTSKFPIGFSQFSTREPIGFKRSSSSLSSSSFLPSSTPSPLPSSSPFKHSSSLVGNKPQNQLPLQKNNIPNIFTIPDPQRRKPITTKDKFTSNITPIKPAFIHRLTPTRPSTTTRHVTPSRPSTHTFPSVERSTRDSRLTSAAIPSGTKKPVLPAKPVTGDRHINTGLKFQVAPRNGDKAAHVAGYEWGYGVLDSGTGNQFFHAEKREEGTTKGSYKIQLPDGRIQTVTYTADDKGYHPKVTYEGDAKFPPSGPEGDVNASSSITN